MGSKNVTQSGIECQSWKTNYPNVVSGVIDPWQFPDNSQDDAQNFCRNPQPYLKDTLWCFTIYPGVDWDDCDVCTENKETYRGMV